MASTVIGSVASQSGEVTAKGEDGQVRQLQQGDEIFANDAVTTSDGATVVFEFTDGSRKGMSSNTTISLDNNVFDPDAPQAEEAVAENAAGADDLSDTGTAAAGPVGTGDPVGKLTSASGNVTARGPDGSERELSPGDEVYANETVVSGDSSLAIFEFNDGSRKGLASNAEITLDDSVFDTARGETAFADASEAVGEEAVADAAPGEILGTIGTVTTVSGEAIARGPDGSERTLESGDELYIGETLVTSDSGTVIAELTDGSTKGFSGGSEIALNESMLRPQAPAAEGETQLADAGEVAPAELGEAIGSVNSVSGEAIARAPDGSERTLESGDELFAGETLAVADGGTVIAEMSDGSVKGFSGGSEVALEESMLRPEAPAAAGETQMADAAGAAPAELGESVGTINSASGTITARAPDGSERELNSGDEVYAGETVVTADAGTAVIEFTDGSTRGLASGSEVTLEAPVPTLVAEAADASDALQPSPAAEEAAGEQVALGTGIPVGTVSSATGDVIARGPDGSERQLEVGDEINADETVVTEDNSTAVFAFYDGTNRGLASNSEMTLDGRTLDIASIREARGEEGAIAETETLAEAEAAAQATPAVAQGAVQQVASLDEAVDPDVAALQKAIQEGADPTVEAEATAAGGAESEGTHSAVFLARSDQAVSPEAGFDTIGLVQSIVEGFQRDVEPGGQNLAAATPPLLFHTLIEHLKQILDLVLDLVEDLAQAVADLIRELLDVINDFLNNLDITDLLNGLTDALQDVANDVVDALQGAITRAIDLVGTSGDRNVLEDPSQAIGDGSAAGATTLFIAFWALDDALAKVETATGQSVFFTPEMATGYDELKGAVNTAYDSLATPVKGLIGDGIDEYQSQFNQAFDSGQADLAAGLNQVEDPLQANDPGLRAGLTSVTGESGTDAGGRLGTIGNAVADEVYSDEDGSGLVADLRGTEAQQGVPTSGGNPGEGTVLGETYDVVDQSADIADTVWSGQKYEGDQYQKTGDGFIEDTADTLNTREVAQAGIGVTESRDQETGQAHLESGAAALSDGLQSSPEIIQSGQDYATSAGGDVEQALTEAQDLGPAVQGYAGTNVGGVQNIADATQEALTPPSSSSSSSSSDSAPGVTPDSVANNLLGDGSSDGVMHLWAGEDHDGAVFHLNDPSADTIVIHNFQQQDESHSGDTIELHDMLLAEGLDANEGTDAETLANYLHFEQDGDNTNMLVGHTEEDGTFVTDNTVVLENVSLADGQSSPQEVISGMMESNMLDVTGPGQMVPTDFG